MAAAGYPTVSQKVGNFNEANWRPLIEQRLDPGYFAEELKYGMGSYFFDFLEMAKRTMNLTTDNPKMFEKLEWENTVRINAAIAVGSAGADASFVVHTDDRDANGQVTVKVGDGIVIAAAYQTSGEDRVYVVTAYNSSTYTATISPFSADGNTIDASQISVEIPAGSTFKINSNYNARGTGLPDGKTDYRATREYQTTIIKNARIYEGGMQALKWREVAGVNGAQSTAFFEGQDSLELDHRKACDDALFLGEINDNATLVQTSAAGGSNAVKSTKGIWNWGKEVGQPLDYSATSWDMSYFYDVKDLFLATNVVAREAMMNVGTDLLRLIEESNLDWIKSYSGGSDLMKASDELGIETRRVLVNGIVFQLNELKSFGNPLRWGNKEYSFSKNGIIIPEGMENATYNGKRELHPSLSVGYLNNNGENRTKQVGVIDGTTGRSNPSNGNDMSQTYILSEMAAIVLRAEQLITVEVE